MVQFSAIQRQRLRVQVFVATLTALTFAVFSGQAANAASPCAPMTWHEIDTAHFRILKWPSWAAVSDDSHIASACEAAFARLSTYWFGKVEQLDRKCDVVLYPNDRSYLGAVGGNASQTAAAVLTGYDGQRTFSRIELRANRADWETNGLPHELTHVLFAQRFAGRKLPAWINEGTALMADPQSKQELHLGDYRRGRTNGTALPLRQLLPLDNYPARPSLPSFYGQSLSLVKCLVERNSPQTFVEFVDQSLQHGYAVGLRDVYGISGTEELQRIWSQYVSRSDSHLASHRSNSTRVSLATSTTPAQQRTEPAERPSF